MRFLKPGERVDLDRLNWVLMTIAIKDPDSPEFEEAENEYLTHCGVWVPMLAQEVEELRAEVAELKRGKP
jgi:HJR/Mrr/RecB family endonuclease